MGALQRDRRLSSEWFHHPPGRPRPVESTSTNRRGTHVNPNNSTMPRTAHKNTIKNCRLHTTLKRSLDNLPRSERENSNLCSVRYQGGDENLGDLTRGLGFVHPSPGLSSHSSFSRLQLGAKAAAVDALNAWMPELAVGDGGSIASTVANLSWRVPYRGWKIKT